ncbi:ArnT family glycosyltransferase [Parasphingorhabdus pacifica]
MISAAPDTGRDPARSAARESGSRAPAWALAAICLLSAVLYLRGIGDSWGNGYYSAAVKSMSQSFENFFFGAFDPAGVVTVDKPPMALWIQVLSVLGFGYNEFAVLFPQALAGVAAVFVLHRTVRRWAGEPAALLAALILALTPITVAINQDNNPDTLLVLLVVAAAYAMTRSVEAGTASARATGWLVLAAFLVGCGFMTKMLQAWMVLPAFVAAYLVGREAAWGRKLADLGVAAVAVFLSSFWWVAATALWPSPKPYIGGSEDGSAWDLIFGYNGFGRVFGGDGNMGGGRPPAAPGLGDQAANSGGGPGPGGGGGFSGEPGILRFANEELAGQISWLLPLCTLILGSMLLVVLRRRSGGVEVDRRQVSGWLLWGGWLVVVGLVFSFAQGTMHPYYTTMLAPAIAAVVGAGLVRWWGWYREPHGGTWLLLPFGVLVTVSWAVVVVLRDPDWNGWVGYVAAALAVLAVAALAAGRRWAVLRRIGPVLGIAAVLAVPAVWSASTSLAGGMGGANPMAGPSTGMGSPGGPNGGAPDGRPPGPGGAGAADPPNSPDGAQSMGPPGGMGGPDGMDSLGDEQRALLDFVVDNAGEAEIPLAVEGGANRASAYVIDSDVTVVGMGGFTGGDDAPSVDLLTEWQWSGRLGYVLLGGSMGSGGPSIGNDRPGPGGTGEASGDRSEWVRRFCAPVAPETYGGSSGSGADEGAEQSADQGGSSQLYDCREE